MLLSHLRAATGAVLLETREESRCLAAILAELGATAQIALVSAPNGELIDLATRRQLAPSSPSGTMPACYQWVTQSGGRVLVVQDWHRVCNAPAHWRMALNALPAVRQPSAASATDTASLIVYLAPSFRLDADNPLAGLLPTIQFAPPTREELEALADRLAPLPAEESARAAVLDSLCGLTSDVAEQTIAESLIQHSGQWLPEHLRSARRKALQAGGLELWPSSAELGGLGGFKSACSNEVIPWIRDEQLAVRRILCCGVPGVGKSYGARWLASQLGADCVRLSMPGLKQGIVGASEQNLKRCLRTIDTMAHDAPLVVVMDEIDKVASEGMDGGTSSGMWAELLTWIEESVSRAVIVATLNHLSKLDAAMESRFSLRFFYDLPSATERRAVSGIHLAKLGCREIESTARQIASLTDGYSSRELAQSIVPSIARLSNRVPSPQIVESVVRRTVPASRTQARQLDEMRAAASTLRRANDEPDTADPHPSRRLS